MERNSRVRTIRYDVTPGASGVCLPKCFTHESFFDTPLKVRIAVSQLLSEELKLEL